MSEIAVERDKAVVRFRQRACAVVRSISWLLRVLGDGAS
jgi:hypothetical protein